MSVAADVRSGIRNARRGGWQSATVVLILGVAVGVVTAVFSIAHAVLLVPLPVVEPDRLVLLWGRDDARSQQVVEVSLGDQRAWLAAQRSFTAIELFGSVNWGELSVAGPGRPFRVVQSAVSSGFFDVLGATPLLGRTFREADAHRGARPTVVLSEHVWRTQFSADPDIPGRLLTVGTGKDATAVEVIGVMPQAFRFPAGAEVWVALEPALGAGAADQGWQTDGVRAMYAIGRLAPDATIDRAVVELSTIARTEELKHGVSTTAMTVVATPFETHLLGPARPALLAIAGASVVLLLVACTNATALLLVQGSARRREVAVRLALGARRRQVVRQLFAEAVVLSLLAGVLGVGLAFVSFDAIVPLAPIEVPRLDQASIDVRALIFALGLCVGTAIAVGSFPAWRHSGASPLAALVEGQPLEAESYRRNPIVNWETATPDYFRTMDIQLVRGRAFDGRDTANAPPVIVLGQALAARLWPGQDPIGKRLLTYGAPGDDKAPGWQTVVGVVEDARYREVDAPRFDLYVPYRQAPDLVKHFVVRVTGDPRAAASALRSAVAVIDPEARVEGVSTMEDIVGRAFAPWRFSGVVVSAFGAIALAFAAVGIAALVAFGVTQRTREIGVRVALGAQARDVILLVAREGAWVVLAGLVAGSLAAWTLRRSVESLLFGVTADDPLTFGGVAMLLALVSLLAAYLPARHAARIDPAIALRAE